MSVALELADAVAATLAAAPEGTFSMEFDPDALAVPRLTLKELETLHVTVVPNAPNITSATRAKDAWEIQIDIGVQKRVKQSDPEPDIAALATFVEEIVDYMRVRRIPLEEVTAHWVRMAIDPLYAPMHVTDMGTFTSVVRLFYLVHR